MSHYWPAAEGQNHLAAKVTLVVYKDQPVRKAQSCPACLIKWCIVILPRRDNKRGSALAPTLQWLGGRGAPGEPIQGGVRGRHLL